MNSKPLTKEQLRRDKRRAYHAAYRLAHRDTKLAQHAEWSATHPERVKELGVIGGLRKYGMTLEKYNRMLQAQHGVCALCFKPPKVKKLSVDHDAETGRVRGLLCGPCNHFRVGSKDIPYFERAVAYLKSSFDGRYD